MNPNAEVSPTLDDITADEAANAAVDNVETAKTEEAAKADEAAEAAKADEAAEAEDTFNADIALPTGDAQDSPSVKKRAANSRLSVVSQKYDINGDGVLDDTEKAMRDLDSTGRGYLTNDKVYGLMQQHIKTQEELFKFKKIIIGLAVFVVLLTLSNLGTSFAAAYLAKDITTNERDELTSSSTGAALETQTTSETFKIEKVTTEGGVDGRDRDLCEKSGTSWSCASNSFMSMSTAEARQLICLCFKSKTVAVLRSWKDGSESRHPVCSSVDKVELGADCVCNGNGLYKSGTCPYIRVTGTDSSFVEITKNDDDSYKVDGDRFTVDLNGKCEDSSDCDDGLVCSEIFLCSTQPSTGGGGMPTTPTKCTTDGECSGVTGQPYCIDPDGDGNKVCGICRPEDNQGCNSSSGEYKCLQLGVGSVCACDASDDKCPANVGPDYTCGIVCGLSTSYPTCSLSSDRDGYCTSTSNGDYCDVTTGNCEFATPGGGAEENNDECVVDDNCTYPSICLPAPGDNSMMVCGCRNGTDEGCDSSSSMPFCVGAGILGVGCGCRSDKECNNIGDTCAIPNCTADVAPYCAPEGQHYFDYGCDSL